MRVIAWSLAVVIQCPILYKESPFVSFAESNFIDVDLWYGTGCSYNNYFGRDISDHLAGASQPLVKRTFGCLMCHML